ncbi:MAG: hypothetical protein QHH24_01595 [Candidatus Bathyarchaeota archaeon]|nr:hypothetical protein [Candidatus Bathyarchaeota archaeon]
MKISTRKIAGTAVFAALVVVFDYALKYSNLKLPFPWNPDLKFDFTGVPIVSAFLIFGLIPGALASVIASVAIAARSAYVIGASMKGLAEFSTILGMAIGIKLVSRFKGATMFAFGILLRVLVMVVANFLLVYAGALSLREYAEIPVIYALILGAFNAIAGVICISLGYLIYEAVKKRVPALLAKAKDDMRETAL